MAASGIAAELCSSPAGFIFVEAAAIFQIGHLLVRRLRRDGKPEPGGAWADWGDNFPSLNLNSPRLPFCFQKTQEVEGEIAPGAFAAAQGFLQWGKSSRSSGSTSHPEKGKIQWMESLEKQRALLWIHLAEPSSNDLLSALPCQARKKSC